MPYIMQEPLMPPRIFWKSKASANTADRTEGIIPMCITMITRDSSTYSTPMKGTSTSVIRRIRLPPPMRQ